MQGRYVKHVRRSGLLGQYNIAYVGFFGVSE